MRRFRVRAWLLVRFGLAFGLVILLAWAVWPNRPERNGISVSQPVFGSRLSATGVCQTVSLSVTNVGKRRVHFELWLECRGKADLKLLAANLSPQPLIPLAGRSTVTLTKDLAGSASWIGDPLFCCRIFWFEEVPGSWPVIPRLYDSCPLVRRYVEIFWPQWVPPWERSSAPQGQIFVSNVEVAEYFRLAYGLTREVVEARHQQAAGNGLAVVAGPPSPVRRPTLEEEAADNAEVVFGLLRREPTSLSSGTAQTAAPKGGNTAPSRNSEAPEGRHR